MIDLHTHILPEIDDGAEDFCVSEEMLKAEKAQGVTDVVLTPHYYGKFYSPEEFLRQRDQIYQKLLAGVPEGVRLILGAEIHFSETLCYNSEYRRLSIGNTRYALLELPYDYKWTTAVLLRLRNFMDETELTPIIAHICRYPKLHKRPSLISALSEMGCLLQVNASAFLNKETKNFAFAALKHNLVHCIGSDCHDTLDRAPDMDKAVEEIKKCGYSEQLNRVEQMMKDILADRQVRKLPSTPVKKFFGKCR